MASPVPAAKQPVHPTPEKAVAFLARSLGEPVSHWTYQDAQGFELMRVYRFQQPDGKKQFRPAHCEADGWRLGDPPRPLPLYHLPAVLAAEQVYVAEGEKCADLIQDLGLVATTSAHGARSATATDWSPLAGKRVVLLPDNDSPGQAFVTTIADILSRLDPAPEVRILKLDLNAEGDDVEQWLDSLPEAWDAAARRAELERLAAAVLIHQPTIQTGPAPAEREQDLPQNLDAERGVLGGLLMDGTYFPAVSQILRAEHFYLEAHQLIYRALVDLFHRNAQPDVIVLCEELESRHWLARVGGDDYICKVCNAVPHAVNTVYHAQIVQEKAVKRALLAELAEAKRRVLANGQTSTQLLHQALGGLARIEVSQSEEDTAPLRIQPWPAPLDAAAFHGIAGDIVRAIEPHSESDPAAILFQFLAGFGNLIGPGPHWRVESSRHGLNLFVLIGGASSKARKGTSFDHIMWILERIDADWASTRLGHGYTSGEGLIADLADDSISGGTITPGVSDKRLFWTEGEFGSVLTIMARDGNTLSAHVRQAWDGKTLAGRSKNKPLRATNPHVSIVGHITVVEAVDLLSSVNAANGFGNRFLWVCARRSKVLPHGGKLHTVNWEPIMEDLRTVRDFLLFGDFAGPIQRHRDANILWEQVYPQLSEGRPGLLGAMTSRAEAQVMRLAALYAVLDRSQWIYEQHLRAGLACWRYAEQSARYIFGDALGDPNAEKISKTLAKVAEAGEAGLSKSGINRKVFSGKLASADLDRALSELVRSSLIEQVPDAKDSLGRPITLWRCKHAEPLEMKEVARSGALTDLSTEPKPWKPF